MQVVNHWGWAWPAGCAALGLAAGAVANYCILRLPWDEAEGPFATACVGCGRAYGLVAHLPILGVAYRRCRWCRWSRPGWRPGVELGNAALWALLALTDDPWTAAAMLRMLLVTSLLVLAVIDLQHFVLPDVITLPGTVAGIAATWLPGWPVSLVDAALSASIGYFAMMALATAAENYYGEEALGQGDWKLVAMLGALLGASKLLIVLLIANVTGAAVGLLLLAKYGQDGRRKLPLGTFLGAAGILMVFA